MRQTLALRQQRAVQRAYRRYADDVYRYALAVLGSPGDAEEVVRRTFLKAYLHRRRRTRTRLDLTALLSIAHDLCRRRAGEPRPLGQAGMEPSFDFVCERAGRALSLELDDRLPPQEGDFLRAHVRVCADCEQFGRSLRRQRAALRALAAVQVHAPVRKFLPARASS